MQKIHQCIQLATLTLLTSLFPCHGFAQSANTPKNTPKNALAAPLSDVPNTKNDSTATPEVNLSTFTEPGVLLKKNGKWLGSDYLGYLPQEFRVFPEVFMPTENEQPLVSEGVIANLVSARLAKAGLKTTREASDKDNSLPFFHVLVLVQPIRGEGYSAVISLRLLESVDLDRMKNLGGNLLYQAITWEKETLVVGSKEAAAELIQKALGGLVEEFTKRYLFFSVQQEEPMPKVKLKIPKQEPPAKPKSLPPLVPPPTKGTSKPS